MDSGSDSSGDIGSSWKNRAILKQEEYGLQLCDRHFDEIEDHTLLDNKLYYALYGIAYETGIELDPEEVRVVDRVKKKILEESGDTIYFSLVFIILRTKDDQCFQEPLFKILNQSRTTIFIDRSARIYKSWNDYLKNNVLPQCEYVYPENGTYTFDEKNWSLKLEFGKSHACQITTKALKGLDVTSNVTAVAGLGTALLSLTALPIAAPVLMSVGIASAIGGIYSSARSAYRLVDKSTHGESISISNKSAKYEWINTVGGAISVGTFGSTLWATQLINSGRELGDITKVSLKGIDLVGKAFQTATVVDQTAEFLKETYETRRLNYIALAETFASVFLLTHVLVKDGTIRLLLSDSELMSNYKATLGDKTKRNPEKMRRRIIKRMAKIRNSSSNVNEFVINRMSEVSDKSDARNLLRIESDDEDED